MKRRALVVATPRCEIQFAEREAKRWLKKFFGRPTRSGVLPHKVCRWLEAELGEAGAKSLIAKHLDAQLFVRRQRPRPPNSVSLLLEVVEGNAYDFSRKHRALTRRESEVLHWLSLGQSNREIAEILNLAPATVSKHLERIYPKLDVENRTAAAHFAKQGSHL